MDILILGAGGMAGHTTAIYMKEQGHKVTGFAKKKLSFCNTIIGNALDKNAVKNAIDADKYDAVVNCIGVLNASVDKNPADGIFLNSYLPHFLAECTNRFHTKVVQISTDCVFSGYEKGNYKENSFRSADTLYGRSKALGELNDDKNITFRTSIVGPDINPEGIGLFNWFMKQEDSVTGYSSAIWTGVTTIMLAKAIEASVTQNITGLYHLVNNKCINKYELLTLFNLIRKTPVDIQKSDNISVNKSLVNTRTDFMFEIPSYKEMVIDMYEWIKNHSDLYPHYNIKD